MNVEVPLAGSRRSECACCCCHLWRLSQCLQSKWDGQMLLTKSSAHPERPGQGWLQTYPAALHNPRAQKQTSAWAGLKQATVVLHGRKKKSDFNRG